VSDIPKDYKIEHDRLVYEMEPLVSRLHELMRSLPRPATLEEIEYNGFIVKIEDDGHKSELKKELGV